GLWQLIQDTIDAQIKTICKSSATQTNAPAGSNKQKIGDFFSSGMDSVSLNQKGITDLKPDLDKIDAITNLDQLIRETAYIHQVAGTPLFELYVSQDDRKSDQYAIFVAQGGLSLPDREFYFATDARAADIRKKYVEYAASLFNVMGYDDAHAAKAAQNLMKIETAMAKNSRKSEDTRDPLKNYNKIAYSQLIKSTPNIHWPALMETFRLTNIDSVIVGQPEFLTALNEYLQLFQLDEWKDYLKFNLVNPLAGCLDDRTFALNFGFYATTLHGIQEPKPRWQRVVSQTNGALGELIGQVYVAEYLPEGTKEKLLEIGNAIRNVYAERIKNLDWMTDATKEKALTKLNGVLFKVGYPDKWKDLSAMQIDRSSYAKNTMNSSKWFSNYMFSKYGKPVDRTEWAMEPQDYNAYYNGSNNEIVVPGCNIIVPGYERVLADDAILYSIIGGSTFGHEITHGFDDQGSKYNQCGNLENWWTPEDSVRFYAKTKLIVEQFNAYVPVDSLHINGENTQGENIADLGGIMMGYEAFKKTKQYRDNQLIAGLNPNQRFFLAYAYAWMINQRPENVANQIRSDEHSPAKYRVIGPLSNMPEFYATFGIKKGDPMWRPDSLRVKIW
ncbi:MAG TPA: M13 family metallopeptidase, partial [Prolixibacteraceae bacterium]|nr:M13 family metallopeptidase [Prolixibacteraceae bacterium]